jgi:hypothetical protein
MVEEHPEQMLAKQGILIKGKRRNDPSAGNEIKGWFFRFLLSIQH